MSTDRIKTIIIIFIVFIMLIGFFYINPFGIELGYKLNGGHTPNSADIQEINLRELKMEYEKQVEAYNLYRDSLNNTQMKWAETAKNKANKIAIEYNTLAEDKLELILEN